MDHTADPRASLPKPPKTPVQRREERLAAALKANIARRKAQAGAREVGGDDGNDNNETA